MGDALKPRCTACRFVEKDAPDRCSPVKRVEPSRLAVRVGHARDGHQAAALILVALESLNAGRLRSLRGCRYRSVVKWRGCAAERGRDTRSRRGLSVLVVVVLIRPDKLV